jgi:hypothetical protein
MESESVSDSRREMGEHTLLEDLQQWQKGSESAEFSFEFRPEAKRDQGAYLDRCG